MFELTKKEKSFLKDSLQEFFGGYDLDPDTRDEKENSRFNSLMAKLARYTRKQTFGSLYTFKVEMYKAYYASNGHNAFPQDKTFTVMKTRLDEEINSLQQNLIGKAMADSNAHLRHPFSQKDALEGRNSDGVCYAMSMDWLRRKFWNESHDEDRAKKSFSQIEPEKLVNKMIALQDVGSTYSKQNMRDMENVLVQGFKGHNKRGFLDLAKAKKKGDVQLQCSQKDDEELLAGGQFEHFVNKNCPKCPRGVLLSFSRTTLGRLTGHAVALFQPRGGDWHLFDANHGEYEIRANVEMFAAAWVLLYKPLQVITKATAFSTR